MSIEHPKISIITPVYNAEGYIADAINMVKSQTFSDWELILIDDCSTDGSVAVIESFLEDERILLLKQETNQRAARARNRGIGEAKGEYIAFLDADDIWMKDKLSKELSFMEEKDCAFAFTAYEFGDENAVGTGKIVSVPESLDYKRALPRTIIFTSTVMFDMRKLAKEDILMPEVPSEDTATWWKVLKKGFLAYGLNEVLTIYRRPAKSLSSNKGVALYRIWNLYRNVEGLGLFYSAYNFVIWAVKATLRRV